MSTDLLLCGRRCRRFSFNEPGCARAVRCTVHAAADLAYRLLAGQVREIERSAKALSKAEASAA